MPGVEPSVSADEDEELARRHLAGDRAAGAALVRKYERWIMRNVREFLRRGIALEDLKQEGSIGFLEAVATWDRARGATLLGWSRLNIRRRAREHAAYHRGDVRAPVHAQNGRGTPELCEAARATRIQVSFEDAHKGATLAEVLPDGAESAELRILREERGARVLERLSCLDPRERVIIERRILAEQWSSLEEIASAMGVTRERVRQLEARALQKLRRVFSSAPEDL